MFAGGCKGVISVFLIPVIVIMFSFPGCGVSYAGEIKGLSLSSMRLVYPAQKRAISLTITNNTDQVWLVQSSVKNVDSGTGEVLHETGPFIITPPLVRLNPGDRQPVKVVYTGHILPADRESVFWVSVRMIPRMSESEGDIGQLSVGIVNNIKLFYRPQVIQGSGVKESSAQLHSHVENNKLILSNPSPFFITLGKLAVNNVELSEVECRKMIPPMGQQQYNLPETELHPLNGKYTVRWQAIDESGGITVAQQQEGK